MSIISNEARLLTNNQNMINDPRFCHHQYGQTNRPNNTKDEKNGKETAKNIIRPPKLYKDPTPLWGGTRFFLKSGRGA